MLVLTRKQNEKIQIGDQITITVLRMKGKAVRLGIEAPDDVNVLRGELVFELPEETHAQKELPHPDAVKTPDSARQPSERNSRRHGLEVGQVTANHWSVEKRGEQATNNPLRGLPSGPLADKVNARSH